jgi:uncharacterized protein with PIN domain
MLGRLARYLRILGCDTEYVHGMADSAILLRLSMDPRILVTRDRVLGRSAPGAVLLHCTDLPGQLRELSAAVGGISHEPQFDRCTLCNGRLAPHEQMGSMGLPASDPPPQATDRFVCTACGHVYWEGSHTARVRADLTTWLGPGAR